MSIKRIVYTRTGRPNPVTSFAYAWDSLRGRFVVFGGFDSSFTVTGETWEYDPVEHKWYSFSIGISPPARRSASMAFDSARGVCVMVGGRDAASAVLGDAWEWDGVSWAQVLDLPGGEKRNSGGHAMAYDAKRGVCVLVGGLDAAFAITGDIFEWNGVAWDAPTIPVIKPIDRAIPVVSWDPRTAKLILSHGSTGFTLPEVSDTTWLWDGALWEQVVSVDTPPARRRHTLVYLGPGLGHLLHGGQGPDAPPSGEFVDAWVLGPNGWMQSFDSPSTPRSDGSAVFANSVGAAIMYGGFIIADATDRVDVRGTSGWAVKDGPGLSFDDTKIELDGGAQLVAPFATDDPSVTDSGGVNAEGLISAGMIATVADRNWSDAAPATSPAGRDGSAYAYDYTRGVVVLFSGFTGAALPADTWEFNGTTWAQVVTATNPPGSRDAQLVYDGARILMFGGMSAAGVMFGDTWEYDGVDWALLSPAVSPPDRAFFQSSFDSSRGKWVIHGGFRYEPFPTKIPYTSTWEFDGTTWAEVATDGPGNRITAAMAFDVLSGRVVLFGGSLADITPTSLFADTWEFNGTTWAQIVTVGPSARLSARMEYSARENQIVLFGGSDPAGIELGDTWTFSNGQWTEVEPAASPPKRQSHILIYDGLRIVVFGGVDVTTRLGDTWVLPDSDRLTHTLAIDGQLKWWNGVSWVDSDGTAAQSNVIADLSENMPSLDISGGALAQLVSILRSGDGTVTPILHQIDLEFDFRATETPGPRECIVYGWVRSHEGEPIADAAVTARPSNGGYEHGNHWVSGNARQARTDAAGYWELSLVETETVGQTVDFVISALLDSPNSGTVAAKIIPNINRVEFTDL